MQYDEKGRLTRAGAEQVIRAGGSVSIGGRIISAAANLPGEAEFAKGDVKAEQAARERLEQQRRDLDAQLAALGAGGPAAATPTGPAAPANEVRTITGADFGPRPVRASNADAFQSTAEPPGASRKAVTHPEGLSAADRQADADADKADADDDAKSRKRSHHK